jgi:hypothetical protein
MAEENKIILDADVKPLKSQLKEATKELQTARQKFGEFSDEAVQAAQKVAGIKDEIESANEAAQVFDPGKRFQALTTAASTAAGGIAAAQGAMALFGSQSEDVEKALLKVQGALALSQGLSQLKDIGKVGDQLAITFKGLTAGANTFKKALISTGIGALVVAVGLLVAYWEDIMALVGGVSKEQKDLNEATQKDLQANQEKLDAIDGQANQLKLQGKSEAEILALKIAQTDEAIKSAEINLANAQATKKAQIEASQRNKDILSGLLNFVSFPLTAILGSIDLISKGLVQLGVLEEATNLREDSFDYLASFVFDPEAVAEEGDATIKEAENALNQLKEKRAGFTLSQQEADKAAGEKSAEERAKQAQKEAEAQAILDEAKLKMLDKQKQEEAAIEKAYAEKFLKLKEAGIEDDGSLEEAKNTELKAIDDKYKKEQAEKDAAFEKQLNDIRTQIRLEGIVDENEKAREQILIEYEKQRAEVLENEQLTAEQKTDLLKALKDQEDQALKALQLTIDQQKAADDIAELEREMQQADLSFKIQKDLLDKKAALIEASYTQGLISEKEFTEQMKANSDARSELDKAEVEAKMQNASKIAGLLGGLSDLVGKETAAGKAFAVAQATIDTYLAAQKAYQSMVGIPVAGPALAAVAAGVAVAGGIANVRKILSTKVPGGGGGGVSAPSISGTAPAVTSAVPTLGNSPVTALGQVMQNQPPLRAYVVESEVTGTQKRVADIERRAGF